MYQWRNEAIGKHALEDAAGEPSFSAFIRMDWLHINLKVKPLMRDRRPAVT